VNEPTSLGELQYKVEKAKRRYKISAQFLASLLVIFLLGVLIYLVQNVSTVVHNQETNTQKLDRSGQILQILVDCTTPGHACYDAGLKNGDNLTAEIERIISNTIIATGTCRADHRDATFAELKSCVESRVPR
jgi:hypothetical protein